LPMADLSEKEQHEVFEILKEYIDGGAELTREKVNDIIKNYKNKDKLKIPEKTREPSAPKPSAAVLDSIKTLNNNLTGLHDFKDKKEAENLLKAMNETFDIILGKFYSISKKYDLDEEVQKTLENLAEMIKNISGN